MQQSAGSPMQPVADAGIEVAQAPFDAPWAWLAAGWRDIWSAPWISLLYGGLFAAASMALVLGLLAGGVASLTLALAVTGTVVGGALAALVFAISVVSVPLLMTERVDAVTAIAASITAVRLNPRPMALWTGLIAGFMALGLASLFLGLIVAFPLIGHATWHAFRELVHVTEKS